MLESLHPARVAVKPAPEENRRPLPPSPSPVRRKPVFFFALSLDRPTGDGTLADMARQSKAEPATEPTRSRAGRPANDPGPLGWSPNAAQQARLDARLTNREIRDELDARFAIVLSSRTVDNYFLPASHPAARPPAAAVALAIAKILGVTREELGAAAG